MYMVYTEFDTCAIYWVVSSCKDHEICIASTTHCVSIKKHCSNLTLIEFMTVFRSFLHVRITKYARVSTIHIVNAVAHIVLTLNLTPLPC